VSELSIRTSAHPTAVDKDARVGDLIEVTVRGRIYKIEDDLIDITRFSGPTEVMTGERTVTVLVTGFGSCSSDLDGTAVAMSVLSGRVRGVSGRCAPSTRADNTTASSVGGSGADGALENPPPGGSPTHRFTYREAS
jgi:hypothetical protein